MQIKCLDPEKKIFEGCLYMGEATGHLTQILGTNVRFPPSMEARHKIWLFSQGV